MLTSFVKAPLKVMQKRYKSLKHIQTIYFDSKNSPEIDKLWYNFNFSDSNVSSATARGRCMHVSIIKGAGNLELSACLSLSELASYKSSLIG